MRNRKPENIQALTTRKTAPEIAAGLFEDAEQLRRQLDQRRQLAEDLGMGDVAVRAGAALELAGDVVAAIQRLRDVFERGAPPATRGPRKPRQLQASPSRAGAAPESEAAPGCTGKGRHRGPTSGASCSEPGCGATFEVCEGHGGEGKAQANLKRHQTWKHTSRAGGAKRRGRKVRADADQEDGGVDPAQQAKRDYAKNWRDQRRERMAGRVDATDADIERAAAALTNDDASEAPPPTPAAAASKGLRCKCGNPRRVGDKLCDVCRLAEIGAAGGGRTPRSVRRQPAEEDLADPLDAAEELVESEPDEDAEDGDETEDEPDDEADAPLRVAPGAKPPRAPQRLSEIATIAKRARAAGETVCDRVAERFCETPIAKVKCPDCDYEANRCKFHGGQAAAEKAVDAHQRGMHGRAPAPAPTGETRGGGGAPSSSSGAAASGIDPGRELVSNPEDRTRWWRAGVALFCRRCTALIPGNEWFLHLTLKHEIHPNDAKRERETWPFKPKVSATTDTIRGRKRRAEQLSRIGESDDGEGADAA